MSRDEIRQDLAEERRLAFICERDGYRDWREAKRAEREQNAKDLAQARAEKACPPPRR
jgi:hypothetical protein